MNKDYEELQGSSDTTVDSYDDSKFWFHGTAIGDDDITRGRSKMKKVWPSETLKKAAASLSGQPIVTNHNNQPNAVVGKVTEAKHNGSGVKYKGYVRSPQMAVNIKDELLEVSPRVYHDPVESLSVDDNTNSLIVTGARFDNLSLELSGKGAAPSNSAIYGETEELSAQEVSDSFEGISEDEAKNALERDTEALSLGINPVIDANINSYAYVEVEDQITDGRYISVSEGYLHQSPFAIGIHESVGPPDNTDGNLGKNIGMSQWFPASQVIRHDRIWLTEDLKSDQQVYAVLYHLNDDGNKDIFRYAGRKAWDASIVKVDEEDSYLKNREPDPSYLSFDNEELSESDELDETYQANDTDSDEEANNRIDATVIKTASKI